MSDVTSLNFYVDTVEVLRRMAHMVAGEVVAAVADMMTIEVVVEDTEVIEVVLEVEENLIMLEDL